MNQNILIGIVIVAAIIILYYGYKKYYGESFSVEQTNRANAIVMFVNSQASTKRSDYPAYARFLVSSKNPYRELETLNTYYAMYDAAIKGTLTPRDVLSRMEH